MQIAWSSTVERVKRAFSRDVLIGLRNGSILGAASLLLIIPPVSPRHMPLAGATNISSRVAMGSGATSTENASAQPSKSKRAEFGAQVPTPQARLIGDWVADSGDNRGSPFAILDKRAARVFVFDAGANLVGSSLVLLGSAAGDESVADIGNRPLSQIRAEERTTPAGRFVSEPGHDSTGEDVVWVDYDSAVAMHRVRVVDPKERRFERIATPYSEDKRISNGCINVPVAFYDAVVKPTLGRSRAIVYVLPELKPLDQVFRGSYEVDSREGARDGPRDASRDVSRERTRVDRTMVVYRPG
jgi:hypothetical protein